MEQDLEFLIETLFKERGETPPTVDKYPDRWSLFRSLVNVRAPKAISGEFLTRQDEVLQTLIAKRGVADIEDLAPVRDNICLWRGDITALKADAIVNAANSGMLGCFVPCHSCIDNVIHTYAGVQLRLECAKIMEKQGFPEPTGQAKLTAAYNLPSKYILHTVGPIISGKVTDGDRRLLASCYRSCLETARKNNIESVAFCCISTGAFHFPKEDAARIAIDTVSAFPKAGDFKRIVFVVFTEEDASIYATYIP
ncbi:MAG: protein-ADP-ribose hydrolase [Oscillospiraceae bacterium]|nr:protein-ADP-ribose hydrolase [Oscillospiraceae bacterium]